ncbi:MAG: alpha/beta fold hydrolase [Deltaproteobacteria bacterium]|nr:alpha/beta fold hydrolase [Deltaproteobacteria bacterium]
MSESDKNKYKINAQNYKFTYSALKVLINLSPLNLNIHGLTDQSSSGSIFLFNHFTRFETFIPQYVLYDRKKVFCRSVADASLFNDSMLRDYLSSVGAVPDNLPNMMDFMVEELNHGHKLVIFPEGAMIKDRRVRDRKGRLNIYKREGGYRRKPHTGAAVIALKSRMLRDLYLMAREKNDDVMVKYYRSKFSTFKTIEETDAFAKKSVEIIPANITFYPMRRDENILEKYVQKYSGVKSKRILEELKIEGNILLKQTDMDVRFGNPIRVEDYLARGYKIILKLRYDADLLTRGKGRFLTKITPELVRKKFDSAIYGWIRKCTEKIRDDYMEAIYDLTTINLGHLIAHALYDLNRKNKKREFQIEYLRSLLFACICDLRNVFDLHLHRSIKKRDYINSIITGDEPHLLKMLERFEKAGILEIKEKRSFILKEKLEEDFPFDVIRIENPAMVLDNEAQSVPKAIEAIDRLYSDEKSVIEEKVSLLLERRAHKIFEGDLLKFTAPEYDDINKSEKRTSSGEPFFYRTGKAYKKRRGVLLVHGFSANPAEMKVIGEGLFKKGYEVYGLRLPGHGTSPADMRERSRKEWLKEVSLGLALISRYCPRFFVIGNSMGALLSLMAMTASPVIVSGFVAIAPAFRVKDKRLPYVTYVDAAQRLYRVFAELKADWPYINSMPENPDINYSQIPYHGLFELYQTTRESRDYIEKLNVPTLFIQAEHEFTVDPKATYEAFERVPAQDKSLLKVDIDKHVITLDEELPVFDAIVEFLGKR